MRRSAVCLLALCASAGAAGAQQAAEPPELAGMRSTYTAQLQKTVSDYEALTRGWPEKYLQELDALQKAFQKAGDLEGLQATAKEIGRFRKEREIPAQLPADAPPALRELASRYRRLPEDATVNRSRRVLELTQKHVDQLTAFKKERTIAGKIPEAVAFQEEIKAVKANPAVTAAEFALADHASLQPPPAPPTPPTPPPAANAVVARAPELQLPAGVRVHEVNSPPPVPGLTFKPLATNPSERGRLLRNLSANILMATQSETSKETSSYYYSYSSSRSGQNNHFLRISLRPASTTYALTGGRILVETYGKRIQGGSGTTAPQRVDSQLIPLPDVGNQKSVHVDIAPISLEMSSYRYASTYYGTSGSRSGMAFLGVVVSVFDDAGVLLHQVTSSTALNALAPTSLPRRVLLEEELRRAERELEEARETRDAAMNAQSTDPGSRIAQERFRTASEAYYRAMRACSEIRQRIGTEHADDN